MDLDTFISKLEDYLLVAREVYYFEQSYLYYNLDDENFTKKLILDLLINATPFDYENIITFTSKKIEALSNEIIPERFKIGEYNGVQVLGEIKKNYSNLEAPYKFCIAFTDGENYYHLPSLTFEIQNEKQINLYAIQNKKILDQNPLAKKLDRHFRKVNKDVPLDQNIANISPSALVSFSIFQSYFSIHNFQKINAIPFMPIRYNAHLNLKMAKTMNEELATDESDRIQFNITNKLLYTLLRFEHHFPQCQTSYDDITGEMSIDIAPQKNMAQAQKSHSNAHDNNIIYDIVQIYQNSENLQKD